MKKLSNYILFFFVFTFIFVFKVNAECSYQERKDLLNAAKNVDIGYEIVSNVVEEEGVDPDTNETKMYTYENYSYKFYVTNLVDEIFIKYYNGFETENIEYINVEDLQNGVYYFTDYNSLNIYNYYFEIYSLNNNCAGNLITTRKIIKPKYNYFSSFSICEDESMKNYSNCNKFITKEINLNESDFIANATKYYKNVNINPNEKEDNKLNINNLLKKYWYCVLIIFIVIIFIIIFIINKFKKRGELN